MNAKTFEGIMKTRFLIESLILLLSMSSPSIAQNAKKHSLPDKTYDMAAGNISGDKVRGPRRIVIKNLNTLRYNYTLSRAVSYTAVGDLWSKLLSVNAAGAETAPEQQPKGLVAPGKQQPAPCGEAQNAVDQADAVIADIKQRSAAISDIKSQVDANRKNLDDLLHAVQVAVGHVTEGGQQLTEALRRNSTVPDGIVSDISLLLSQNPKSLFLVGVDAAWVDETDVKKLQADTEKSKKLVDTQKSTFAKFITDQSAAIASADEALARVSEVLKANKPECVQIVNAKRKELTASKEDLTRASSLLDWESSELDKIQAAIPDLLEGSTKQSSFIQAREALREWKGRMDSLLTRWNDYRNALTHNQDLELHTDPFSMVTYGDCEFAFGGSKTTAVTLTRTDQLPGTTAPAEQVLSLTIECTSPFTISAGVAFNTILQQQFAIRPVLTSTGSTVNTFVLTSESHFHAVPLGMIHARFYEPCETISLHASFGLAGNFRSQSSGGSAAEFLLGPSVSFFRTMFITPGVYLGSQATLGSGFKVGDTVPSNITEPPLKTSYKGGFGLAITFTKP